MELNLNFKNKTCCWEFSEKERGEMRDNVDKIQHFLQDETELNKMFKKVAFYFISINGKCITCNRLCKVLIQLTKSLIMEPD